MTKIHDNEVTTTIETNGKPTVATIVRTVMLAFTFINLTLALFGKNLPWTQGTIYQWATAGATLVVVIWNWWQNNSFTKGAITADKIIDTINKEK